MRSRLMTAQHVYRERKHTDVEHERSKAVHRDDTSHRLHDPCVRRLKRHAERIGKIDEIAVVRIVAAGKVEPAVAAGYVIKMGIMKRIDRSR